ncbi:TPA: hypothetical protein JLH81_005028 [Escherichia coli]|nr:hypothetical protein [Escherichia coli]
MTAIRPDTELQLLVNVRTTEALQTGMRSYRNMFTEEEKICAHILSVLPDMASSRVDDLLLWNVAHNHQYGIRLTLTVYDTNQDDNLLIFD